jgi:AbrB family looped-hinge helix DNA binding protein
MLINQTKTLYQIEDRRGLKMKKTPKDDACCAPGGFGSCKVDSLVSVDERGQMVLPKELRDKAGIKGGDKLAVITWEKEGKVCCVSLIKAEEFGGMIKGLLGPLMGDVLKNI